jgi:hypothetical protein
LIRAVAFMGWVAQLQDFWMDGSLSFVLKA